MVVEAGEGGFRGPKRINHVALSVSSDLLGQQGRADLASFFDNVFGWAELDMMTIDGQRMIFSVNSYDRFVFLLADEAPMSCPPGLPGDQQLLPVFRTSLFGGFTCFRRPPKICLTQGVIWSPDLA